MSKAQELLDQLNEGEIQQIADLVKSSGKKLVDLRTPLATIFKKNDIDFVFSPVAHFRIKSKGKTIVLVNKKYADKAEEIVGDIAIGFEGDI
jgi:hypothetical protein|tara:strand:+ start:545 stop:820 length:276 start_codon:yes stop_codon:yes gene_type:complete